jgi:hypothetical protein
MRFLRRLTSGEIAAVLTVGVVVVLVFANGDSLFSSGPLNESNRRGALLGGVRSHAEIGSKCSACHAPPWSGETMADRCLACHTNVRKQLETHGPMHGAMRNGKDCRSCHTEHRGAHGCLTSMADFDHNWAAFKLTGKHTTTDCKSCHKSAIYQGTPQTCVSCHAEPTTKHKGNYGTACTQCHTTTSFTGAKFEHKMFPINHGRRKNTCATCHTDTVSYKTYTCYNCHEHNPDRMARIHVRRGITEYDRCLDCHKRRRGRRAEGVPADGLGDRLLWAASADRPGVEMRPGSSPELDFRELLSAVKASPSPRKPG